MSEIKDYIDLEEIPPVPPLGRRSDGGIYLTVARDTPEGQAALRYAARLSAAHRGHLAIVQNITIDDFQHWGNVEQRMRQELRAEAESFIWNVAKKINELNGVFPSLSVEEGPWIDVLLKMINEDPDIRMLILGGGTGSGGPGPLVSYFTGKGLSRLRVPLVIVPGHLEPQAIDEINGI